MYSKFSINKFNWLLFCFIVCTLSKNFDQKTRFKSLICVNNSTERVAINLCKLKVTRNTSSLAINVTIKKVVDKPMYLRAVAYYKYGLIYRQIVPVPEIEVCGMLKNIRGSHPAIVAMLDVLGESIKPLLKGCPYYGQYNFSAMLDPLQLPSLFPSGMYKVEVFVRTPDMKFVGVVVQIELVSSIKTSF